MSQKITQIPPLCAQNLAYYQAWRKDRHDNMPTPVEITQWIDEVLALVGRWQTVLEAIAADESAPDSIRGQAETALNHVL